MAHLPYSHTTCADAESIALAVRLLAHEMELTFEERPLAVVVLDGAKRFALDLTAELTAQWDLRYLRATSYQGTASTGRVELEPEEPFDAEGRDVLIIDDILDTGLTLQAVIRHMRDAGARSVRSCVLLRKGRAEAPAVEADFVGMHIEDRFVVGYGLDLDGAFRDLPYIAYLDQAGIGDC